MAPSKKHEAPRNDALAVLTDLFGRSAGWDEQVAAATDAAMIAEEVYALRERHGLSQSALAKLIDSSQSAIARMEDAKYHGHSISVLRRMAAAVGEQVIVRFIPAKPTFSSTMNGAGKSRIGRATKPLARRAPESKGKPVRTRPSPGAAKKKTTALA